MFKNPMFSSIIFSDHDDRKKINRNLSRSMKNTFGGEFEKKNFSTIDYEFDLGDRDLDEQRNSRYVTFVSLSAARATNRV